MQEHKAETKPGSFANRVALISGITGQDGSYLAEFLLYLGYTVHGIIRRSSTFNTGRLNSVYADPHDPGARLFLHYADLTDPASILTVLSKVRPNEIYHLGAQSHVRVSFDIPDYTSDATGLGTMRLLEAIRILKLDCKFYQAGSSEMFGGLYDGNTCLDEKCRFHPRSPYGCAKVFAHNIVVNYRESYGMFAANGILFNHESPRRGETFVTRKITKYVADLYHDRHTGPLYLGNLDAKRDWGYSPEYVVAMWKILQQERPDDFVIATGETHSVAEFLDEAFQVIDEPWREYVQFDGRYVRPAEVEVLLGNADKAARVLKWKPQVTFKQIVKIMVTADITKQETGLEEVWKNA